MSYSFLVHGTSPTPEFLRDRGVSYKPIRIREVRAWIAWRGRPSRGVLFSEDDGGTRIKIPVCASPDDVNLAQELAAGWAAAHGVPVDVEEDPPSVKWAASTSPAAPPGMPPGKPGQYFTPAQVLAWPEAWHDYQNTSIWATWDPEIEEEAASPIRLFSGPIRTTAVGKTFLDRILHRPTGILSGLSRLFSQKPSIEADAKTLVAALCDAQDPRWARVPMRPWFVCGSLPAGGVESRNLLHPSNLLGEPFFDLIIPGATTVSAGSTAAFTVFVPDELQLIPTAHYVAIRESGADWLCVPFKVFLREMGEFVRPLDESSWVAERPSEAEWNRASQRMKAEGVGRVPHEEDFLEAAQEIGRRGSPSQGQSDEENDLINRAQASKSAGSLQEALQHAHRLALVAPDSSTALYLQSRIELALGNGEVAIAAMKQALERREFNRGLRSGMYADLAEQIAKQGATKEARTLLDRALEVAPADWPMRADVIDFRSTLADGGA